MVDLDRRKTESGEADLAVALRHALRHLAQHGGCAAATRGTANEWDDAEVAGEAAAVLDLHEGADAVEPGIGLDAADRADVAGDRRGRLLASLRDHSHVVGEVREGVATQVRGAARDVDAAVRSGRARGRVARLPDSLVRDAAAVDDRDVGCIR